MLQVERRSLFSSAFAGLNLARGTGQGGQRRIDFGRLIESVALSTRQLYNYPCKTTTIRRLFLSIFHALLALQKNVCHIRMSRAFLTPHSPVIATELRNLIRCVRAYQINSQLVRPTPVENKARALRGNEALTF